MNLRRTRNYLKHVAIKGWAERSPRFYAAVQKWRYRNRPFRKKIVTKSTDVVIEGFPRCGNSFAAVAFRIAQKNLKLVIATHTHSFAQVELAVQYGIPTMVLVREPRSAVLSNVALGIQLLNGDFELFRRSWNVDWNFQYYSQYYRTVTLLADEIVIVPFGEVTRDFGKSIDRLNGRFGTSFRKFEHSEENQSRVFQAGQQHLSPSPEREKYKKMAETLLDCPRTQAYLQEAERVHNAFMKLYR